jgi:hypothetical protein
MMKLVRLAVLGSCTILFSAAVADAAFLLEIDVEGADDGPIITYNPLFSFGGDVEPSAQEVRYRPPTDTSPLGMPSREPLTCPSDHLNAVFQTVAVREAHPACSRLPKLLVVVVDEPSGLSD